MGLPVQCRRAGTGSHRRGEQIFRWCTFKADLVTKKIEEIYGEEIPCYSILLKKWYVRYICHLLYVSSFWMTIMYDVVYVIFLGCARPH